jgi:hypothetical protein
MRLNLSKRILFLIVAIALMLPSGAIAKDYQFSGHGEQTGQRATISFSLDEGHQITNGAMTVESICQVPYFLGAGELTFAGPMDNAMFRGTNRPCGGESYATYGHLSIIYSPGWGVYVVLNGQEPGAGPTGWIFDASSDPFQ